MNRNNKLQHDSVANTLDGATTQARELEQLARWMDSVFEIPILKLRFGLDALLGLLPGGGDVGAALVSVYILSAANRYGVSRITILRMAVNIALDIIAGSIPIAGDLFDAYWKSNDRNVALLRRHLNATPNAASKLRRADRWFIAAVIVALGLLLAGSLTLAYFAVTWLISALSGSAGE
ncbi:MAG TPA: DUF4112 domain-containing protein [Lacipirellulaceae bacterium]|nr:DUF4112 domain-containing protein [Lacipirellulaceae bacterium]